MREGDHEADYASHQTLRHHCFFLWKTLNPSWLWLCWHHHHREHVWQICIPFFVNLLVFYSIQRSGSFSSRSTDPLKWLQFQSRQLLLFDVGVLLVNVDSGGLRLWKVRVERREEQNELGRLNISSRGKRCEKIRDSLLPLKWFMELVIQDRVQRLHSHSCLKLLSAILLFPK